MNTFIIDFVKEGHHYHAPTRLLSGPLSAFYRDHSSPLTAHCTYCAADRHAMESDFM